MGEKRKAAAPDGKVSKKSKHEKKLQVVSDVKAVETSKDKKVPKKEKKVQEAAEVEVGMVSTKAKKRKTLTSVDEVATDLPQSLVSQAMDTLAAGKKTKKKTKAAGALEQSPGPTAPEAVVAEAVPAKKEQRKRKKKGQNVADQNSKPTDATTQQEGGTNTPHEHVVGADATAEPQKAKKKKNKQKASTAGGKVDSSAEENVTNPPSTVGAMFAAVANGAKAGKKTKSEKDTASLSKATGLPVTDIQDVTPAGAGIAADGTKPGADAGENGVKSNEKRRNSTPFKRVNDEEWLGAKGSWSNSYEDTFGANGWGFKAQQTLGQVRGKDFRHEKTKKKRGSYRGGAIETTAVNSFKFESDDE